MPEIISRKEARALGLKRYFTGKPCCHGHVDERYVAAGLCAECSRQIVRLDYQKHRKKRLAAQIKNYIRTREKRAQYKREYHVKHGEKSRAYDRERHRKVADLLAVLKSEAPELLKEFDL
jgi:hypothetical protein